MKIAQSVYQQIIATIGNTSPELGGILGSTDQEIITHYHFDEQGYSTEYSYTPNTHELNKVLADWSQKNIYFVGMVHSHKPDCKIPSCMDIEYAQRILKGLPETNKFYLPILVCDEEPLFFAYQISFTKDGVLKKEQVPVEII